MIKIKLAIALPLTVLSVSVVQIHAMGPAAKKCFIGGYAVGSVAAAQYMQQRIDSAPASQQAELARQLNDPSCYQSARGSRFSIHPVNPPALQNKPHPPSGPKAPQTTVWSTHHSLNL